MLLKSTSSLAFYVFATICLSTWNPLGAQAIDSEKAVHNSDSLNRFEWTPEMGLSFRGISGGLMCSRKLTEHIEPHIGASYQGYINARGSFLTYEGGVSFLIPLEYSLLYFRGAAGYASNLTSKEGFERGTLTDKDGGFHFGSGIGIQIPEDGFSINVGLMYRQLEAKYFYINEGAIRFASFDGEVRDSVIHRRLFLTIGVGF